MSNFFEGLSDNGSFEEALSDAIEKAKQQLTIDLVKWNLIGVSGENGGFVGVNQIKVSINASSPADEDENPLTDLQRATAFFQITDGVANEESKFVIKLVEMDKIVHARRILLGEETQLTHISGKIIKQFIDYNPGWSFHLDPQSIDFFENAVEICDASITFIEENLPEIGDSTLPNNNWCPWSSKIIKEL
jgi:hypothetical protein